MSIEIDLSGRTALVTGASQGIGATIARTLQRAGCQVVLNHPDLGDGQTLRDAESLAGELCDLRENSAHVYAADVSDPAAVELMMQSIANDLGKIDLYQWAYFIAQHARRHVQQLAANKAEYRLAGTTGGPFRSAGGRPG